MDESYTDRPETLVTYCFLKALTANLSTHNEYTVLHRVKDLLSFYSNMFTKRNYETIKELIDEAIGNIFVSMTIKKLEE